jgi:hypothetical protein
MDAGVAEFIHDRLLHLLPRLVGLRALSLAEACQPRQPTTPVGSGRDLDEPALTSGATSRVHVVRSIARRPASWLTGIGPSAASTDRMAKPVARSPSCDSAWS